MIKYEINNSKYFRIESEAVYKKNEKLEGR